MNKIGQSGIKRIFVGTLIGFSGLVMAAVGYSYNSFVWGRIGLIIMAIGGWILSWTK